MSRTTSWAALAVATLAVACSTTVPIEKIRWSDSAQVLRPSGEDAPQPSAKVGYLSIETDRDPLVTGDIKYQVRRPFDLYSPDGALIRGSVDNQGWRNGEEPRLVELAPGRYVVASTYFATYRKVQVEILPGLTTAVPEAALSEAPGVFAR